MTKDHLPPKLLWPDEYAFAVIGKPDNTFQIVKSRHHAELTPAQIAYRLYYIAKALELGDLP